MTSPVDTLREAASAMRASHGPKHKRHAMWEAIATHLEQVARYQALIDDGTMWSTSTVHTDNMHFVGRIAHEYLAADRAALTSDRAATEGES